MFFLIALIYVGTLIAAILIVDKEELQQSPCPGEELIGCGRCFLILISIFLGRAPADDSGLQDSLRILSISFMSVVTALTFFLGAMMLFESRDIFRMMSKGMFYFVSLDDKFA